MQLLSEVKNLPVYTKSGKHLGRIVDIVFDPTSQLIIHYQVSKWPSLSGLWHGSLLIGREQVISISKTAMIVEDSVVGVKTVPEATLAAG